MSKYVVVAWVYRHKYVRYFNTKEECETFAHQFYGDNGFGDIYTTDKTVIDRTFTEGGYGGDTYYFEDEESLSKAVEKA